MADIREKILSITKITQEHKGVNNRVVIGLMNVGQNPNVELYWFDLLEKLENELGTRTYLVDGAVRKTDFNDLRKFPIAEARARVAKEFIRKGIFSGTEARIVCAEPWENATLNGLEEEDLFKKVSQAYELAGAPENRLRLRRLEEHLSDLHKSSPALEDSIKEWRSPLQAVRQLLNLNLQPGSIAQVRKGLKTAPERLFMGLEEYIDTSLIDSLREGVKASVDFYEFTEQRSRVMLDKILTYFEETDEKVVFISATGYHWPYLTKGLAENGYSYYLLMPELESSELSYDINLGKQSRLYSMVSDPELVLSSIQDSDSIWEHLHDESDNKKSADNSEEELLDQIGGFFADAHKRLGNDTEAITNEVVVKTIALCKGDLELATRLLEQVDIGNKHPNDTPKVREELLKIITEAYTKPEISAGERTSYIKSQIDMRCAGGVSKEMLEGAFREYRKRGGQLSSTPPKQRDKREGYWDNIKSFFNFRGRKLKREKENKLRVEVRKIIIEAISQCDASPEELAGIVAPRVLELCNGNTELGARLVKDVWQEMKNS